MPPRINRNNLRAGKTRPYTTAISLIKAELPFLHDNFENYIN